MKIFKALIFVLTLGMAMPALAAIAPTVCRQELDDTYDAVDEAALNIALQNLGLCLEIELYPNDVKEFLNREAICIHIAGEEPYSGERAVELDRLNRINKCDSIADDKDKLLKHYEKDPMVTRALKNYGNKIYPGNITIESPISKTPVSPGNPAPAPEPNNMIENSPGGVI